MSVNTYLECNNCEKRILADRSLTDPHTVTQMPDGWYIIASRPDTLPEHFCSVDCVAETFDLRAEGWQREPTSDEESAQ